MCGIIGYLDDELGVPYVLDGLEKLEYRGYDSCGLAINQKHHFEIYKSVKRIKDLRSKISSNGYNIIAHTRWATHGKVSIENAHPIKSYDGKYLIVHNGIIENYQFLKEKYLSDIVFNTETDTEVIVNLLSKFSLKKDSLIEAIKDIVKILDGSFACLIIDNDMPDCIYFMKKNSPLLIGQSNSGFFIASDILAFNNRIKRYCRLNDFDVGYLTKKDLYLFNNQKMVIPVFNDFFPLENVKLSNNFNHYMEKEIYEEPLIIKRYLDFYFKNGEICFDKKINDLLNNHFKNIYIIGSGTSYHAGLLGSYFFKNISKINSYAFVSSEFYIEENHFNNDDLFIVISQSGETADLINVMKQISSYQIIAITNVVTSTIGTMANGVIDMMADREIAVASTKAYLASVTILYLLANYFVYNLPYSSLIKQIDFLNNSFKYLPKVLDISKEISFKNDLFFLGKNNDYFLAMEASLKLKEISYIHSESFQAGELKHGSIALITPGTPVIAIISNSKYHMLIRSAISEVKSRGAKVYVISTKNVSIPTDDIILDNACDELSYMVISPIFQLIAYYAALNRGNDIDKPRNLAKSVTVL